jgi:8-oxo-dGTP pyrophosphatase MutT (NUDIX family)
MAKNSLARAQPGTRMSRPVVHARKFLQQISCTLDKRRYNPELHPKKLMAIAPAELPVIKAAGGILLRSTPRGEEVMIVYRNRYQDWTLPKGKLRDGESFPEAALREVEEETGCSCRLGTYLGAISYAYNGVPKVVMFWKMAVLEEKPIASNEEISEAAWMPVAAAMQRMTHAQEKSLLARICGAPRIVPSPSETPVETAPALVPALAPAPASAPTPEPVPERRAELLAPRSETPWRGEVLGSRKDFSPEERSLHARLSREVETFRVELAFLERRSQQPDKSWISAASEHLNHSRSCLERDDIEGGMQSLYAARRYSVLGLNPPEMAARAQVLREEARKVSSWRSGAIQRLLALPDEKLSAARLADAMALRDEETIDQYYTGRIAGNRLRLLLIVCGAGVALLLALLLLDGLVRDLASVLLFGLLGASACAAQSLIHGRGESRAPNVYVMLAPVLLGGLASLAGYALYQYLVSTLDPGRAHPNALFALAFLFGCLGQLVLARFTGQSRPRQVARPA